MPRTPAVNVLVAGKYDGKDLERAYKDLNKLRQQVTTSSDKFKAFGDKMQSVGKQVSSVGKKMTLGVTLPIVGVGIAASKMAMDFDTSMSKIVGLVGIAQDEVDAMRQPVIDLASEFGRTGAEAADALFFITSAGLRGTDAMDVLEASLKASAAGLGEVQTIADLATSAMNAYGSDTLKASAATDVLTAAVREGKLEPAELAGAMGAVLPIASAMGVSFDEVGAAFASMSRTGTGASEAATQVRGILSQIAKETPKGKKALKSVDLTYKQLRKTLREEGLLATLQLLKDRFGGNTIATAKFFGNVRALTGVMDMLGAGAETTEDIFGRMSDTTGILDDAFAATAETSGFKLQQALSSVKNSLIEIGDAIAPFVEQAAAKLQELVKAFKALSPEQKKMAMMFAAIAAAVGPLLLVLGTVITALGAIVTAIGAISLPVVAVVAGIAAFVAVLVLLWNKSEAFRNGVIAIWNAIRAAVSQVVDQLKKKLDENRDKIEAFKEGLAVVWNFLQKYVIPAIAKFYEVYLSTLIKVLGLVIGKVIDFASFLFDVGVEAFKVGQKIYQFGETVGEAIADAIRFVQELPDKVRDGLGNAKQWLLQTGKDMIQGLLDGAGSLLPKIGTFMLDMLPGWIVEPFKRAMGIASPSKVFAGFGRNIIEGLTNALEQGGEKVRATMQEAVIDRIKSVRADLKAELDEQRQIFYDYAKDVSNAINGIDFGAAFTGAQDATNKIAEAQRKLAEAQAQAAQPDATDADRAQVVEAEKAVAEAQAAGTRVGTTFMDALKIQADRVKEFAEKVRTLLAMNLSREALQQVLNQGLDVGMAIADELITGGATTIDEANDLVLSTQAAADEVGLEAAQNFLSTGVNNALRIVEGFDEQMGKGGPGRKELMRIMDDLARKAERDVRINVAVTRSINEVVTRIVSTITAPPRAMGGPVSQGSPYLIGEKGPELFVPDVSGYVVPNSALNTNTRAGLGSTINLTVNAGMGTDGAEVGRQVVDALKRYQRTNGPLPIQVA
jgi:TP901 family phage tail tape measure protein